MTKRSAWFSIRSSLWFIPVLLLMLSAVSALVLVQVDLHFESQIREILPAFLKANPEGARQVFATIGSSMITVAGVVFSVTIVTLSLTSNQYSPRVLRNFMRDRLNQTVLGVFVGVFIYSILVLRAVGAEDNSFVPQLALWVGITLAIVGIGFLIAFIHHTAASIQAPEIAARIAGETLEAITAVTRTSADGGDARMEPDALADVQWQVVRSCESGYMQDIDVEKLFNLACDRQVVLRVECPVGDFIVEGRPLISVGGAAELDQQLVRRIHRLFGINSYRTIEQDPEFGVRQIVDIALRALSAGINDATTAINCVDYLGVILHSAVQIKVLPEVHLEGKEPRLMLQQLAPERLVNVALNEIRQNASDNTAVLLRLLRLLRQLREEVEEPSLRMHLRHHAELIGEEAKRGIPSATDRNEVERALDRTLAAKPE